MIYTMAGSEGAVVRFIREQGNSNPLFPGLDFFEGLYISFQNNGTSVAKLMMNRDILVHGRITGLTQDAASIQATGEGWAFLKQAVEARREDESDLAQWMRRVFPVAMKVPYIPG